MSFSVEVLNSIRNNADAEYQTRVPAATKDNISEIGRTFSTYNLVYNTFITSLVHKIGLTLIQSTSFTNKLKRFKSGTLLSEQDIEEIFVQQFRTAEGSYDKDGGMGTNGIHPFKRRTYQDAKVAYHRMNRQDKYVMTLSKIDVIRAFRNPATLDSFITEQFNAMYNGAEFDEYVHMKKLFSEAIANKDFYNYDIDAFDGSVDKTKAFIKACKKAVKDMGYPNTIYNPMGVKTKTDKGSLVMFINKDVAVDVDVDLYAQIFGPNYAKMDIEVVELDNFGDDNTGTYALICDKDWFKVYDTLNEFEELRNPEGLYTNYWYHVWQVLSYSKFKNAVRVGLPIAG